MKEMELRGLLDSMTLREKLGQLTQLTPEYFGFNESDVVTGTDALHPVSEEDAANVGTVLNICEKEKVMKIQREYLKRNRHGIPLLFMADVIHGFRTIFPIPLAIASSFDPSFAEKAASYAANEATAEGVKVTFSPMVDLTRDPRWGRVMEGNGEDPYLNTLFAKAYVKGYQKDNLSNPSSIASCVKHFAAYGAPLGGREYNGVELSDWTLHESYFPGYKAAIDAKASMVMAAFNTIGEKPATGNKSLLKNTLREKWGFDGVLISDYNAVNELIVHKAARNKKDAAKQVIKATLDIEMMSTCILDEAEELIRTREIDINLINESVYRILKLKSDLGLFENPYIGMENTAPSSDLSLEVAKACPILLKNEDSILPLNRSEKIAIIGPFAKDTHVVGGWSMKEKEGKSLYDGMRKLSDSIKTCIDTPLGSLLEGIKDIPDFSDKELEDNLQGIDTVLVAVGENQNDTGEGASKTSLTLSYNQMKLIKEAKKLGKKVITIVFSGRPMVLSPIVDDSDAILQAWFLGTSSGDALAELIYGISSPRGKCPMSFPVNEGQIPVFYNHCITGRPEDKNNFTRYVSRYLDAPNEPLFPFGFGLTYGNNSIKSFKIEGNILHILVKNKGKHRCTDTIQIYIEEHNEPYARPSRLLKKIRNIELGDGESRSVAITLTKEMFLINEYGNKRFQPGIFRIYAGFDSNAEHSVEIELTNEEFSKLEEV